MPKDINKCVRDIFPHLKHVLKISTECQIKDTSVPTSSSISLSTTIPVFTESKVDHYDISVSRERRWSQSAGPPRRSAKIRSRSVDPPLTKFERESFTSVSKSNSLASPAPETGMQSRKRSLSKSMRRNTKNTADLAVDLSKSNSLMSPHPGNGRQSRKRSLSKSLRRKGKNKADRSVDDRPEHCSSSTRRALVTVAVRSPPKQYTQEEIEGLDVRLAKIVAAVRGISDDSAQQRYVSSRVSLLS